MNKPRKNSGANRPNNNGQVDFNQHLEELRMQVVELEYKARFWKAQYELRYFTLQSEKLQPDYDAYIEQQKVKNEELRERIVAELEKTRQEMIDKGELPPDPVAEQEDKIQE